MSLSKQIAVHLRDVHYDSNWVATNLHDQLKDVTIEQANTQIQNLNTIAMLTYHIYYYVDIITRVLKGGPLEGSDKYSYDMPPIATEVDWQDFKQQAYAKAKEFGDLIEQLPDEEMFNDFAGGKYGSNYRNIVGNIEHTYYHLGQIAIIKKMVQAGIT